MTLAALIVGILKITKWLEVKGVSMELKENYGVGDILCDMHYGLADLPDNLEVISKIVLRTDNALKALIELLKCPSGGIPTQVTSV